jgi:iron complex transport system substrate-binding protein
MNARALLRWGGLAWRAVALALACGLGAPASAAIVLRDDAGAEHRLETPPQRIVSLLPSLTESVCALGGCARLVGVDRYSNWPASVDALPHLGGLEDAQIERIAALRPDVVLASKSARVTERLQALGLRVVLLESQTHADVHRALALLAQLLGTPAAAERVWGGIDVELRAAAARVPPALRGLRVYFEVGPEPYAAGAASFIGETLARLGLANAVPAALGPFPKLNPEYVLRAQPDIVMASQRAVQDMAGRPGWRALRALQASTAVPRRACGFASADYELLIRPGPRMGQAAGLLADCVAGLQATTGGAAR